MIAPLAKLLDWSAIQLERVGGLTEALNGTGLNLTAIRPVIPKENILLIEGSHDDAICPKDQTEDLWQSWGQPDIWRLPHGHVGVCCGFSPGLPERVLRWLAPRMNEPAVTHRRPVNGARLTYRYSGRDYRLTDVQGRVVQDILAGGRTPRGRALNGTKAGEAPLFRRRSTVGRR